VKVYPRSLTSRLVVTAVALVAIVGLLVGTAATLAMRSYLYDRLDGQVHDSMRGPRDGDDVPGLPSGGQIFIRPGSVTVISRGPAGTPVGLAISRTGVQQTLSASDVRRLVATPADGSGHTVRVAGTRYRVMVNSNAAGTVLVVGQVTADVDATLRSMLRWFVLLTLLGVATAALAGTALVRRQLRPLHAVADAAREVAAQDLSTGETTIHTRVADDLTDTGTEVGQVGAALNTLIEHVDSALAARHRSEQQVRQFVADASHELRTPLSTIHGYAELSRRTPDDPGALSTALNKVETEAGRMSALVEDLLLLARLDSGRPLVSEEVDLTRLTLEAVADARVLAPDHHWRFDLPDEPVTATGDADRLHQVVTNLLNNARNHTPAGTTVTVRVAATAAGGARIDVHDDGPGLPEDIAGDAFERFTRGDSSRTRASGGAGLGLSLVSAIAAAHGGTASVVSRPGDTTFTVELPA